MAELRDVPGTAFVVAEFRDDENREAFPLYHDPYVHIFLDEETKKAADRISAFFPPVRNNVRLRTRYFDDRLSTKLEQGCKQVVILGAGLDTRAQRMAFPGVAYFEIDDASTLSFKRAKLEEQGIDPGATLISGDYVRDGLLNLLVRNGFRPEFPTHIIWEGNTMYLRPDAIANILTEAAKHISHCSVSFDYLAEEVVEKRTGDREVTAVAERFAAMGAAWIGAIRDLGALACNCGFKVSENMKFADLHRAYWPDKKIESVMYDYYSICTLESDRP